MGTEIFLIAVCILLAFACMDLVVGVSNDAVNFLNSSIGSKVAPKYIIMIVASLGILAGVLFSNGMMEVARKGIFHPQLFTMPDLITVFLAVMIADILILDLFNTFGLPTSTTVSIVFELLGAAVGVSLLKILGTDGGISDLVEYINVSKAAIIIFGILLSVVLAFIAGAIVQFLTRLLFTFEYQKSMKYYGALWGGIAMAIITLFILVKGAKGASFISAEEALWIRAHQWQILFTMFIVSAFIFQILISLFKVNIFKPIVLVGTFALAMAFAANDLVNFIGVPMAGLESYKVAMASSDPLSVTMVALGGKVQSNTLFLLLAGVIMVVTLWISRKAKSVTDTTLDLSRQEEGFERFESMALSRIVVRMVVHIFSVMKGILPKPVYKTVKRRFDAKAYEVAFDEENRPSFDLLRASVNLMVASALVSYATSMKLPLSTTYVTFMVAMGTSFSDRAWGLESAVYRVTGVLTVIGGWFMTAVMAFSVAAVFATVIYSTQVWGVVALLILVGWFVWKTHHAHKKRAEDTEAKAVFNLKKVKNASDAISTTFDHMAHLLKEIREVLNEDLEALFTEDLTSLRQLRKNSKKIRQWSNIITANVFKSLRLLQKQEVLSTYQYSETVRSLQSIADSFRDIVLRSYVHISDNHEGLLRIQVDELREIKELSMQILLEVEQTLCKRKEIDIKSVEEKNQTLIDTIERFNLTQSERIRNSSSKTRLSILFYSIMGNSRRMARHNVKLLNIFQQSFEKEV